MKRLVGSGKHLRRDRWISGGRGGCPTPLALAASNGHVEALKYLLQLKEFKDQELVGDALVHAVQAQKRCVVEHLIFEAKVDPNFGKGAALKQAIALGDVQMVKFLAENTQNELIDSSALLLEAIKQNQVRIFSFMLRHPFRFPTVDCAWLQETVAFAAPEIIRVMVKSARFEAFSEDYLREVVKLALGRGRLDNASIIFAHSESPCFFGRRCYESVFSPLASTKMRRLEADVLELLSIDNLELVMRCAARVGNNEIFQGSLELLLKHVFGSSSTSDQKFEQFMESIDYSTRYLIARRDTQRLKSLLNLFFDASQATWQHLCRFKCHLAAMDCFYLRALMMVWEKNWHMRAYYKSLALPDACESLFDCQLYNLQDEIGMYLVD